MRQVLENIKAECYTCGVDLQGTDLLRRGNRFYCQSDFDITSPEEKLATRDIERDSQRAKRILGTDTGQLALNHDFTDWTVTNATAPSSKVWTATGTTGKISKDLDLTFGQWYKIKVTASPSLGTIVCYNSTDASNELGTNSFETRFVALDDNIEFRNLSASTNTITLIEIRND